MLFGSGVGCIGLLIWFVARDGDLNVSSGCVAGIGLDSGMIVVSSALLSCSGGVFAVDVVVSLF